MYNYYCDADMVKLVDTLISGVSEATRAGSNPVIRTYSRPDNRAFLCKHALFEVRLFILYNVHMR